MHFLRTVCVVLALVGGFGSAQAQFLPSSNATDTVETATPSPNDIREFLRLLGDPSVQEWIRGSAAETGVLENGPALTSREQINGQLARIAQRIQILTVAYTISSRRYRD